MIRLVAIDLDGTLFKDDKTICKENIEAIQRALEKGCKIVLASGRSFESMVNVIDTVGLRNEGQYAIGLNGGVLFQTMDGKLLARNGMKPEEAVQVIELSRKWTDEVNAQLYDGEGVFVERWDTTTDFYEKVTGVAPKVVSDLKALAERAIKIGFFLRKSDPSPTGPLDLAKETKARAEAAKPNHSACLISAPYLVEFCDVDNNKGTGLQRLGEILGIDAGLDLLDQNNIALGDVEHEVLVLVREQVLDDIVSGDVVCRNDADEQDNAADLCIEVQLACLDDDIAGEHIVQHNVLDEVVAVVLLVVILLDVGKCDGKDARIFGGCFIRSLYEYRIIGLLVSAERLVGITVADEDVMCIAEIQRYKFICGADLGEVAAGDDCCVLVHDADGSVHGIAHLVYQSLEQSVGHKLTSLLFDVKYRT